MNYSSLLKKYTEQDYTPLSLDIQCVIESRGNAQELSQLKDTINRLFGKAAICEEVIYTKNTDKLFFGMSVYPRYNSYDFKNTIFSYEKNDKDLRITNYTLEIDSKLCDPSMGLTGMELTAILLHEMGHIVLNGNLAKDYRNAIELYCTNERTTFDRDKSTDTGVLTLIEFGFRDFINKTQSFFYKDKEEIQADAFVHACGYGDYLLSAFNSINKSSKAVNKNIKNKFIVNTWILNIYKDISNNRTDALRKLNKAKQLTGSVNEKKKLDIAIRQLNRGSIVDSLNESVLQEAKNKFSFIDKMRMSGLRGLKNDLYELKIQVKSTSDEDGSIYLLRMINARIATLEEYISYHTDDMKENEIDEWQATLAEYIDLRETLVNKSTIKKVKMYGLFTDYNNLPPEYIANMNSY